jgi:hypothetical protein
MFDLECEIMENLILKNSLKLTCSLLSFILVLQYYDLLLLAAI